MLEPTTRPAQDRRPRHQGGEQLGGSGRARVGQCSLAAELLHLPDESAGVRQFSHGSATKLRTICDGSCLLWTLVRGRKAVRSAQYGVPSDWRRETEAVSDGHLSARAPRWGMACEVGACVYCVRAQCNAPDRDIKTTKHTKHTKKRETRESFAFHTSAHSFVCCVCFVV